MIGRIQSPGPQTCGLHELFDPIASIGEKVPFGFRNFANLISFSTSTNFDFTRLIYRKAEMKHPGSTLLMDEGAPEARREAMEYRNKVSRAARATVGRWIGWIAILGYASICGILFYRTSLP